MEINLKKLGEQAIESTAETTKMRLSEDASSMVFQLFTKNVYSNPIGTVVREITSNCFDSHTEAGVNAPVVIRKHKDAQTGTQYISFIDYGVGMCPDRVKNIYGVYFESTKRVDNTQIGGFGIGGKTPLAYKRSTGQGEGEYDNSFYVITVFDKVKYYYCIYEGAESPVISLLHSEPTTDRNGTEIQIPVLEADLEKFQKEMTRQLYYFENIIFEGFEYENYSGEVINPLPNDYQIVRGKTFLFRGDKYNNSIHVCLGRVAYPIDYSVLGLSSSDYSLPIALKLEVGDVNVTVSRESIDYSESTIKMLKKKLEEAKQEIVDLISKQYQNIVTLEQYFTVKHDFGKLEFPNGASLYVGNLIKQKDVDFSNFKYQFMKMPNDKQLFRFFFEAQMYGKKPRRSRYSSSDGEFEGGYESLKTNRNLLYIEGEFNRKIVKQAYLKEEYTTYYIIRKRNVASNWVRSEVADLFNVHIDSVLDDKGEVVPFIKSLAEMQEEYMELVRKYANDYDTLEVPADFVASRKRGSGITPELRKQTIPVKFVGGYSKDRVKLSTLFDYNMPIFYGTADDEYTLRDAEQLYGLLFSEEAIVTHCDYQGVMQTGRNSYRRDNKDKTKASIAFIQLAQNNVKYMEHCKKAKHVSQFFPTMLRRKESMVMEYFQTHELVQKFNNIPNFYREGFINRVSDKWGKKVDAVAKLIDAIPAKAKDDSIRYEKSRLAKYFKLDDIKQTKEQMKVIKMIEEIEELNTKNTKTLGFFNIPYDADRMDDELITILQVSMSL
jgi:hypothetical protein